MVRLIEEDELSIPVQCETDRHVKDFIVVFDDQTYTMSSVGNHQRGHQAVNNLAVRGRRRAGLSV
ncbi:hypothetical protein INR49_002275, partial [Caranx melampygus]